MAATGGGKKGNKKKKGQTVPLTAFLSDGNSVFAPPPKRSWADDDDDVIADVSLAEEYGGPSRPEVDMSKLPSAPRASRGVDIDMSRLPREPPYTAFLGNLPFDINENDIRDFFRGLRVENIRFPQEQGRMKGFGYAEFYDLEELKSALALSDEKIRNRSIRVDIAGQNMKDGRGGGRGGFDDKTSGDWRRDEMGQSQGGGMRDRGGRDDRRDGGFRRATGPADTDECWRREDPAPPNSNGLGHDDRGFRGRDDNWGDRGGFRNDRYRDNPRGFRDDPRGGYRDDPRGGYRDDPRGGYRDDPRGGYRDDPRGGYRDDLRGGYRDDPRGGYRDDPRGGYRDDPRGGYRDDPRGGFRDDRNRNGYRNERSGFNDSRGNYRNDRAGDSGDVPRERPKLNLKPRTSDNQEETAAGRTTQSSIFGGARPVDTAAKERQIEEKLMQMTDKGKDRQRGAEDSEEAVSSIKDSYAEQNEPDTVDNWRDENPRQDKTRVMRPGLVKDSGKQEKQVATPPRKTEDRGRGRGSRPSAGRGKSPNDRRQRDGANLPPKYEEPAKPDFVQSSKFAALGLEDDDDEEEQEETSGEHVAVGDE